MPAMFLVFMGLAVAALADGWHDKQGRPAPASEARGAVKGFGGWLLLTSDTDWRQKWETARDTVPHFNEAKNVAKGQVVFALLFFSNPQLTGARLADVTCDLDIARPDGTLALHQSNQICFRGMLKGDQHDVYLSAPVIQFSGDPDDPIGEWTVRATLRDNERHVSLTMRALFTLR